MNIQEQKELFEAALDARVELIEKQHAALIDKAEQYSDSEEALMKGMYRNIAASLWDIRCEVVSIKQQFQDIFKIK